MSMSPMQYIGDLVFQKGFRMITDQSQTGYIYFGIAKSGTLKTEAKWGIVRCKITDSNKIYDFEWANGTGLQTMNCVWNTLAGTAYNGNYTFQGD